MGNEFAVPLCLFCAVFDEDLYISMPKGLRIVSGFAVQFEWKLLERFKKSFFASPDEQSEALHCLLLFLCHFSLETVLWKHIIHSVIHCSVVSVIRMT
jgi:hypothetical protein